MGQFTSTHYLRMKLVTQTASALLCALASAAPEHEPTIREMVKDLKDIPKSWVAGFNNKFNPDAKPSEYAHLMGSLEIPAHLDLPEHTRPRMMKDSEIPASFDPRDGWGAMCPSLNEIRDQGSCGSCWAFGGAEAMSDRACIQSNGAFTASLSTEDVLSCCVTCGFGCNGGYTAQTWKYFMNTGIVTGDLYDGAGCRPYSIAPCVHHSDDTSRPNCEDVPSSSTPACNEVCQDSYTANPYSGDKHNTGSSYKVPRAVQSIQEELMTYGPAEASFTVYNDFMSYTGGVYYHVTGKSLGGHAVKIMGWGTDADSGMDYWLIANSWNYDWGEEGFFRIRRGTNECGIEGGIYAGNFAQ